MGPTLREQARQNRWIVYSYCFIAVSLTGGTVYGWPALRKELREEDLQKWSSETALGAAFTAGAWSAQGVRFFTGLARDRYGTSLVTATCLLIVTIGAVGLAFSESPATIGMSLFAQGIGSGVQLCVQPVVANLFPKYAGAVVASLSGAFQVSGLVYLVITAATTRRIGFLAFAVLVVLLICIAIWLLPRGLPKRVDANESIEKVATVSDMMVPEDGLEEGGGGPNEDSEHPTLVATESELHEPSDTTGGGSAAEKLDSVAENEESNLWKLIFSWKYFGLVQWFSLVITPLQYYIGSIGFQLEDMGDTGKYVDVYSIIYGCVAILSPVGGYLADRYTLGLAHALPTTLCALSFFSLALGSIPLQWQTLGLAFNAVGRMWVFAVYFAHVGKVFGYRYFGSLAGLGLLTSAVFSLLQYPLLAAASDGHATLVNSICGTLLTAQLFYCGWLHVRKI